MLYCKGVGVIYLFLLNELKENNCLKSRKQFNRNVKLLQTIITSTLFLQTNSILLLALANKMG